MGWLMVSRSRPARRWGARSQGLVGLLLALLAPLTAPPPASAAEGPVRIGFIGTLTGARAVVGRDALDGLNLAFDQFAGRPGGEETELLDADDKMSARVALQVMDKQIADGVRLFIAASADPEIQAAMADRAAQSKAFLLMVSLPPPRLAGKNCSPWVFSLAPTVHGEHAAMAHYFRSVGYTHVWLAGPDTKQGRGAAEIFRRYFAGSIVGESWSRPGGMNFDQPLAAIGKTPADALYLLHSGGMAVNFIRQYGAKGLKRHVVLFAPGSTLDQPLISASGDAVEDALSAGPWSDDTETQVNQRMVAEFEARFGRPPSIGAAYGFDAGMLLDAAFRTGANDPRKDDALRQALRTTDFPSVRGPLRFASDQFPLSTWYLRQVIHTTRGRIGTQTLQTLVKDQPEPWVAECPMRWDNPLTAAAKDASKTVKGGSGARR
jgi:branched-chain amino acid transport system substrate-binding protein